MTTPRLNRELALEEARRTPDGAGGFTESWETLGTLWAELRAGVGRVEGAGVFASPAVGYRIIVRAAPQGAPSRPKAGQRLVAGTRRFAIEAVTEHDPEGRYLICYASEEIAS